MTVDDLRKEPMMDHLMGTLEEGRSLGHFGRLVFAMVGRHFMSEEELQEWLRKDPECDERTAKALIDQVQSRDYNPPKRERILEWMGKQDFPICPNPEDPEQCNVYRNLEFPREIYESINEFHARKAEAREESS